PHSLSHHLSALPYLHSFPTRRSSDLPNSHLILRRRRSRRLEGWPQTSRCPPSSFETRSLKRVYAPLRRAMVSLLRMRAQKIVERSEEHTSELQSRVELVCRLLLGKKK